MSKAAKAIVVFTFLLAGSSPAWASGAQATGAISGRVTNGSTNLGVPNVWVHFTDLSGDPAGGSLTDSLGYYTSPALPTGFYVVGTYAPNDSGLIDEVYNDVACPGSTCSIDDATPVSVTANATTANINFSLAPGGRITGTVTKSSDGQPVPGTWVYFYNTSQDFAGSSQTNAQGVYTSPGLTSGSYLVGTQAPAQYGLINEVFDDIPCIGSCWFDTGTPVNLTAPQWIGNINFALSPGGHISGTVTNASTQAVVPNVSVDFYTLAGNYAESASTDMQGVYTSPGLPSGSYFVKTYVPSDSGLIDELFDNVPCPRGNCSVTAGTPVNVSAPDTAVANFALSPGGRISGTITNSGTGVPVPVPNLWVTFYSATHIYAGSTSTDASGVYTSPGLVTGSYYVRTNSASQLGLVDELYDNVPCVGSCDLSSGTQVPVTAPATATANFVLTPGGRISGTVTDAQTLIPVPYVWVEFYTSTGSYAGSTSANGQGVYTSPPFPTGSYFVRTTSGLDAGLIDELFNNIPCFKWCDPTTGTPVAVTAPATSTGVDFALLPGARITGTVTNAATGVGIPNAWVHFYTTTEAYVGTSSTNAQGQYTSPGLVTGSYLIVAAASDASGLVAELFDNIPCVWSCSLSSGTPVAVTAPGGATVNFALSAGGRISGSVTNSSTGLPVAGVRIYVYTTSGSTKDIVETNAQGVYTSSPLPTGAYIVRTYSPPVMGLIDELYNNIPCVSCSVTAGTPVGVTAPATTANVNFALDPGGRISGIVTNAQTGLPVANVWLDIYTMSGYYLGSGRSDAQGGYTSPGLPGGSYVIGTWVPTESGLIDELFDNIPCPRAGCDHTTGTPVAVTVPNTTGNINFALSPGGRISGTVTKSGTGLPLPARIVRYYAANGMSVGSSYTNIQGVYTSPGLPSGSYYVKTEAGSDVINELFDNIPCPNNACVVTSGTPVAVTAPSLTSNINFVLAPMASSPPLVTIHPVSRTAVAGTVVSFTAAAVGAPTLTVQWQASSDNGATWSNVTGATSTTYTFTGSLADNGKQVRAVFTNGFGTATTEAAILTVRGPAQFGDFDGDNRAGIGVWRPSTGRWFVRLSSTDYNTYWTYDLGGPNDVPVPADFDGDGRNDLAVFRPSTGQWLIRLSTTEYAYSWNYQWGTVGDVPVPADYDGDGRAEIAIWRPSTGQWFMLLSTSNYATPWLYWWGTGGDVPVPADYDGDGRAEIAVRRPSTGQWFMLLSTTSFVTPAVYSWGTSTDVPVVADYDGDGRAEIAVRRPTTGQWFLLLSGTGFASSAVYAWGMTTDLPVPADYDGDGQADIAVWRSSTGQWFLLLSTTGYTGHQVYAWGASTDKPLTAK